MKFTHCAAFTFGRGLKCMMGLGNTKETPSPNTYTPTTTLAKRSSTGFHFGHAQRENKVRNESPSPNEYHIRSSIGEGPKYSIVGKKNCPKEFIGPAPNVYTPKLPVKNISYSMSRKTEPVKVKPTPCGADYKITTEKALVVPSYKFGKEKRNALPTCSSAFPGPGKYDTKTEFAKEAPKFSFGKEERGVERRPMTPGPNAYKVRTYTGNEGSKITISPCPRSAIRGNNFPGPGRYDPLLYVIKPQSPKYRIGTAKRKGLNDTEGSSFPGPDQYDPNMMTASTRPKTPSWRIGTGKRPKLYSSGMAPGPGMYTLRSDKTHGPKYTIVGKRNFNFPRNSAPGPGQYNSFSKTYYPTNPKWSIGTSTRDDTIKKVIRENIPGPGNYNAIVRRKNSNNIKIGTEKRRDDKSQEIPGPGQYRIPCSFDDVNDYTRQQGTFDENYRYV